MVVDEAYVEFSQYESSVTLIDSINNLVVLRTLSKALGMASLRMGVLMANQEIIAWLNKIISPYPLPQPSINFAIQGLTSKALNMKIKGIKEILEQREWLYTELVSMDICKKVWRSSANFILIAFNRPVMQACMQQGIVLRDMESKVGLPNTVRITVCLLYTSPSPRDS